MRSPINMANGHILNAITVGAGWPQWKLLNTPGNYLSFSEAACNPLASQPKVSVSKRCSRRESSLDCSYWFEEKFESPIIFCTDRLLHLVFNMQCAMKVLSNSPGLVDFCDWAREFYSLKFGWQASLGISNYRNQAKYFKSICLNSKET